MLYLQGDISGALRLAQGYSLAEVVLPLEGGPLAPLVVPREPIRDLAYGGFADGILSGGRRRKIQQLDLNVRSKVVQAHDLAHPLPTQAAQPREIGVIFGRAPPNHVFKVGFQFLARETTRPSGQYPVASFTGANPRCAWATCCPPILIGWTTACDSRPL